MTRTTGEAAGMLEVARARWLQQQEEIDSVPFRTVCLVRDIPNGEARMFPIGDAVVGVFHIDGEFFALEDHCPHAGASLAHGIITGETVRCRIHHWRFCLRTGAYLDEDKPQFKARAFRVRLVGEDVQVEV